MQYVYKVCLRRPDAQWEGSSLGTWGPWTRFYELGEWTTPVPGTGLFAFSTQHAALNFARNDLDGNWILYRCEHAGRMRLPPRMSSACWLRAWWQAAMYYKNNKHWPSGTVAVRALHPVAVITYRLDRRQ